MNPEKSKVSPQSSSSVTADASSSAPTSAPTSTSVSAPLMVDPQPTIIKETVKEIVETVVTKVDERVRVEDLHVQELQKKANSAPTAPVIPTVSSLSSSASSTPAAVASTATTVTVSGTVTKDVEKPMSYTAPSVAQAPQRGVGLSSRRTSVMMSPAAAEAASDIHHNCFILIGNLKEDLTASENRVKELEKTLLITDLKKDVLETQKQGLEMTVEDKNRELSDLQEVVRNLKVDLSLMKEETVVAKTEIEVLKLEASRNREQLSEKLYKELAATQEALETAHVRYGRQIETLRTEVAKYKLEKVKYMNKALDFKTKLRSQTIELQNSSMMATDLHTQVRVLSRRLEPTKYDQALPSIPTNVDKA